MQNCFEIRDKAHMATFLEEMGIQGWRANGAKLPAMANSLRYKMWGLRSLINQKPTGVVWLEQTDNLHTAVEVEVLLDAMLKATHLMRHPLDIHTLWITGGIHLVFGERLAQHLLNCDASLSELRAGNVYLGLCSSRILVTHHPADLLSHPERKAEAWRDLQQLM